MELRYLAQGDELILFIGGELDEYAAASLRGKMDEVIAAHLGARRAVFDLSALTFMDSTGVGGIYDVMPLIR